MSKIKSRFKKNSKKIIEALKKLSFNQIFIFLSLILLVSFFIFIFVSELLNQGRINNQITELEKLTEEFTKVKATPVTYGIDNIIYVQNATEQELLEIQNQNPNAEVKPLEGNIKEYFLRSDPLNPNWELENQRLPSSGLDSTGLNPEESLH